MKKAVQGILLLVLLGAVVADAGDYGGRLGIVRPEGVEYVPRGSGVLDEALSPRLADTYVPQELFGEYGWHQWEYTNYARNRYLRYVDANLEGDYYYDVFGSFLTRGWLIYDARKEQPRASEGSSLLKSGRYGSDFRSLLISSDRKGQYHYSMTIGDEIAASLTPLTFRKPAFNGTQFDFKSDNLGATVLLSRVSAPLVITNRLAAALTNTTDLTAGRVTAGIGPMTLGATFVNGHQGRASLERFDGNPFKGHLTTVQASSTVGIVTLRVGDDSPEDGEGGAILYSERIIVKDVLGNKYDSADVGFAANRDGGTTINGFPTANGADSITLEYDLRRLALLLPTTADSLREVTFELQVANDYKVEVASDVQTNADAQPVFLPVARARGNIKDTSNRRVLRFNYGLPTANQIAGFSIEVIDVAGFRLYGEYNINSQYRQMPNGILNTHRSSVDRATAWMVNVAMDRGPWFGFGEAFAIEDDYNTSFFLTQNTGQVDYSNPERHIYDFVDDNDDQDRWPDQRRAFQGTRQVVVGQTSGEIVEGPPDQAVFPGWDENGAFISDFNQNDSEARRNQIPDFDEPFLRFAVDRPEYLFGVDMNNNGWIDRFEDDNAPDYPYKLDHKGFNIYGGYAFLPDVRLTLGHARQELFSSDHGSRVTYAMFTFDQDFASAGRLRIYERIKKVRDEIADERNDLPAFLGAPQVVVPDLLAAEDAWINTIYLGYDVSPLSSLWLSNKVKYETWQQAKLDEPRTATRTDPRFFGLVNKAEYRMRLGAVSVRPRLKSELFYDVPFSILRAKRHFVREMATVMVSLPILHRSTVEGGVEHGFVNDLETRKADLGAGDRTGDQWETSLALQLSNRGSYLGYESIMQIGLRWDRASIERKDRDNEISTGSILFVSFLAGVQ